MDKKWIKLPAESCKVLLTKGKSSSGEGTGGPEQVVEEDVMKTSILAALNK